jgi:WD40 repeat protein
VWVVCCSLGAIALAALAVAFLLEVKERALSSEDFTPETELLVSEKGLRQVAFHPDGGAAFYVDASGAVRQSDLRGTTKSVMDLLAGDEGIRSRRLFFSSLNRLLAADARDGRIEVFDVLSRSPVWQVLVPSRPISTLAVSADGSVIAAADTSGNASVWRVGAQYPLYEIAPAAAHDVSGGLGLALSPDGRYLARHVRLSISRFPDQGEVSVTDLQTAQVVWSAPGQAMCVMAFSPDGARLALGSIEEFQMRSAPNGDLCWKHRCGPFGNSSRARRFAPTNDAIAFSSDSSVVAAVGSHEVSDVRHFDVNRVFLFDAATGREIRSIGRDCEAVAIHPRGRYLATWSKRDGRARLWDVDRVLTESVR